MISTRWRLAVGAIVMAAVASVASAQVTTGSVTGRVTDKNGNPLSGATVQVKSPSTGFVRGAQTNLEGR